jgi:DNA-binding GntR family transcriptional regulator
VKGGPIEEAYDFIRQNILDGVYHPAQRLIESQLIKDIGVGRYHIRVALERLQAIGLVSLEPNRGASVTALELRDVLDILEAREVLEVLTIRLATKNMKPELLDQLNVHFDDMKQALQAEQFERYSEINTSFHEAIYCACGNKSVLELLILLKTRLTRLHLRTILLPGRADISIAEHRRILEALRQQDPDKAEEAIRIHIGTLGETVKRAWNLIRV